MMVLTSLACSVTLMRIAWNYNSARPTLTVIESTHHGIWNYPFPAVTICNINRVSLQNAKQFVQKLWVNWLIYSVIKNLVLLLILILVIYRKYPNYMSEEFLVSEMGLMNELLNPGVYGYNVTSNLTELQNIFDANGYSITEVAKEVSKKFKKKNKLLIYLNISSSSMSQVSNLNFIFLYLRNFISLYLFITRV